MSKGEIAILVLDSIRTFVKRYDEWKMDTISVDSIKTFLDLQARYEAEDGLPTEPVEDVMSSVAKK